MVADYALTFEHCSHEGEVIECWGLATNKTDEPVFLVFHDCQIVDDEGNSFYVHPSALLGKLGFPDGAAGAKLIPQVPVRFHVTVPDAHSKVNQLNFILNTLFHDNRNEVVFKDVPVN